MSLRGLLVLIAVLALAVVLLLRANKKAEAPGARSEDAPLVRAFSEAAVRGIDISCVGSEIAFERTGGESWKLTKPSGAEADPRRVHEVVAALQDARVRKVVLEKGADGAPFGLQPPACALRVDLGPGGPPVALRLGRTSPVGSERYAAGEDGRVVLTDGALYGTVSRGPDAFREKRLIPVSAEAITRMALTRPDGRIVLAKVGDAWQVESPRRDAASLSACANLARGIVSLEIGGDDSVPPPREARPDRRIEIRVSVAGVDRPWVAFVAAAGVEGKRLAWREGSPSAGLVDESQARELVLPADGYFEKRIVSFSLPDVRRVALVKGATRIELQRAGESAPWTGTEGTASFKVAGEHLVDFLNKIRSLTATGFEDARPAGAPEGEIDVRGESAELARLSYGSLGKNAQWVTTPARPGAVFRVETAALGAVPTRSELAEKP